MSASRPAASLAKRARAAAGSFNKSSNVEDAVAERLTLGSKAAAGRARSSWCLTPWGGGCKANDGGLPLGADEVARTICESALAAPDGCSGTRAATGSRHPGGTVAAAACWPGDATEPGREEKAGDCGLEAAGRDAVAAGPWSTAGGTVVEGGPIRDESVPVGDGS